MSEISRETNIPQCLLNTLSDINENELLSHVENNTLHQWLCAWHEEMKRELYDFANNRENMQKLEKIEKYILDNKCNCDCDKCEENLYSLCDVPKIEQILKGQEE